jgi:hypothetical protein
MKIRELETVPTLEMFQELFNQHNRRHVCGYYYCRKTLNEHNSDSKNNATDAGRIQLKFNRNFNHLTKR